MFPLRRQFSEAKPEWMDRPDVDPVLLEDDLNNIRLINRYFGGHTVAHFLFELLVTHAPRGTQRKVFLDVATGSADLPRLLLEKIPKDNAIRFVAVDFNSTILRTARSLGNGEGHILFVIADAKHLPFRKEALDGVVCSLALHHFSAPDGVSILSEMRRVSRGATAVGDLTRSWLALAGAWLLTTLWMRNPVTQHDAILSVRRAYSSWELIGLAETAGWQHLRWKDFPFFRQAVWDLPFEERD